MGRASVDLLYSASSLASSAGEALEAAAAAAAAALPPPGAPPDPGALLSSDAMAAAEAGLAEPLLPSPSGASDDCAPLLEPPPSSSAADEARRLLGLALPLMLQSVSAMLLTFVSTAFAGHLNDPMGLSAVVLSSSLYNICGVSITIGLASAMDTLCGQAFGARNYPLLGEVLQRARLICWAACVPIVALWLCIEPVLLALGQDPELCRLAAVNMRIMVTSLLLGVINDTTRRYLVSQRAVLPVSCCYLATTTLSPLYNWLLIFRLGLGVPGAAWALVCCTATNTALLSCYRYYRDWVQLAGTPQATWAGWRPRVALRGWWPYLQLAVPAASMICLEWWLWEALIILSGLLPSGSVAVGVMGLCIQITNPSYMIPSSFGSATAVRVSNLLGAGDAAAARMASRVAAALIFACTLLLSSCTYLARGAVVRVFTEDPTIRAATEAVVPAVAASIVGDGMVAVLSSVLRASGRQATGAAMNLAGYYGLALPLAYLLGFQQGLGVKGFWLALAIATAVQAAAFFALIERFDWGAEVKRARALAAAHQQH